ncbi:hypothetical protein C1646_715011 [Rhizophagus diaphanus]|nr:hypothetical protein C1646_715011 [Rhizophagus diaphanus] [Rhizophagus sp. MUCL 43196]
MNLYIYISIYYVLIIYVRSYRVQRILRIKEKKSKVQHMHIIRTKFEYITALIITLYILIGNILFLKKKKI